MNTIEHSIVKYRKLQLKAADVLLEYGKLLLKKGNTEKKSKMVKRIKKLAIKLAKYEML